MELLLDLKKVRRLAGQWDPSKERGLLLLKEELLLIGLVLLLMLLGQQYVLRELRDVCLLPILSKLLQLGTVERLLLRLRILPHLKWRLLSQILLWILEGKCTQLFLKVILGPRGYLFIYILLRSLGAIDGQGQTGIVGGLVEVIVLF